MLLCWPRNALNLRSRRAPTKAGAGATDFDQHLRTPGLPARDQRNRGRRAPGNLPERAHEWARYIGAAAGAPLATWLARCAPACKRARARTRRSKQSTAGTSQKWRYSRTRAHTQRNAAKSAPGAWRSDTSGRPRICACACAYSRSRALSLSIARALVPFRACSRAHNRAKGGKDKWLSDTISARVCARAQLDGSRRLRGLEKSH